MRQPNSKSLRQPHPGGPRNASRRSNSRDGCSRVEKIKGERQEGHRLRETNRSIMVWEERCDLELHPFFALLYLVGRCALPPVCFWPRRSPMGFRHVRVFFAGLPCHWSECRYPRWLERHSSFIRSDFARGTQPAGGRRLPSRRHARHCGNRFRRSNVTILLGQSHGPFKQHASYATGYEPGSVVTQQGWQAPTTWRVSHGGR
jgi:hypothetical protein